MHEPSPLWKAIPSKLPDDVVSYGRTPEFTPETLPDALKSAHSTKPGVWALIHVLEGQLFYSLEPPHGGDIVLAEQETAPIPPEIPHRVAFNEAGLGGVNASNWWGVAVPAGKYSIWTVVRQNGPWTFVLDPRADLFHTVHPDSTAQQIRFPI
ncbi:MAG: DUF1971 domain-containing protein, partial [Xanthobacteraceae bacterium]|nr:DUF1971 domain-containing protein [Xanthobacteraceae bacterium]